MTFVVKYLGCTFQCACATLWFNETAKKRRNISLCLCLIYIQKKILAASIQATFALQVEKKRALSQDITSQNEA